MLYSSFLLVVYFKTVVCICQSKYPNLSLSPIYPLVTISLLSTSTTVLLFANKFISKARAWRRACWLANALVFEEVWWGWFWKCQRICGLDAPQEAQLLRPEALLQWCPQVQQEIEQAPGKKIGRSQLFLHQPGSCLLIILLTKPMREHSWLYRVPEQGMAGQAWAQWQ